MDHKPRQAFMLIELGEACRARAGACGTGPTRAGSLHGFTLIELLVVVSIVALLIALLLPALGKAKFQAETVTCLSRMRQLSVAQLNYCQDNGNRTPGLFGVLYDYSTWIQPVCPYMGFNQVTRSTPLNDLILDARYRSMKCPTDVTGGTYTYGGTNYFFTINWSLRCGFPAASWTTNGVALSTLGPRVFLFIDGGYPFDTLHPTSVRTNGIEGSTQPGMIPNHLGLGNSMSRIDGSASFYPTKERFVPVGTRQGSPWMYRSAWVNPSWGYTFDSLPD